MPWNHLQIEISTDDHLIRPLIGPGDMSYDDARAEVQSILDGVPEMRHLAQKWRQGVKDDTLLGFPFVWAVYEHTAGEARRDAMYWCEDYARLMRQGGVDVAVAALPDDADQ